MADSSIQKDRFSDSLSFINGLIRMVSDSNEHLPPYTQDTRKRDERLLEFSRSESILSSVLAYAVARQKAAPWLLTGAARQVSIYSRMLHRAHKKGWRTWLSMQATTYYATNIGFISEIVTNQNNLPIDIYGLDSTRCKLTNNLDKPIIYYPKGGKQISLLHEEILHANSMPSSEEKMNYAGFCATERALNFVRMSLAILNNHLEVMGAKPAKGFLLGTGIRDNDWKKSIEQFKEDKKNDDIFNDVMALLTTNSEADLKLIPLSNLPEQFDIVKYAETLVNGICAAYGVPAFNVWAMSTGSFGRGLEAQVSNQEASRSGAMEFVSAMQEELSSKVLPATVAFTFDLSGSAIQKIINENQGERIKQIKDLYEAKNEVSYKNTAQAMEAAKTMLEAKQKAFTDKDSDEDKKAIERALEIIDEQKDADGVDRNGEGLITRMEGRQLLAAENFIPQSWTETEEDITVTDIQVAREIALENPRIREAAGFYHNEPVVQYLGNVSPEDRYKSVRTNNSIKYLYPNDGKLITLWETGDDMIKRKYY